MLKVQLKHKKLQLNLDDNDQSSNSKYSIKSLEVFPQDCLCKRVVLVVFVTSVHARAFW